LNSGGPKNLTKHVRNLKRLK